MDKPVLRPLPNVRQIHNRVNLLLIGGLPANGFDAGKDPDERPVDESDAGSSITIRKDDYVTTEMHSLRTITGANTSDRYYLSKQYVLYLSAAFACVDP